MKELKRVILTVQYQLYAKALVICIVLAFSLAVITSVFTELVIPQALAAAIGFLVGGYWGKIFQNKKSIAVGILHQQVGDTEFSLDLLDKRELNVAEQLQLERLAETARGVRVPTVLFSGMGPLLLVLMVALAFRFLFPLLKIQNSATTTQVLKRESLAEQKVLVPRFQSATVRIQPPAYTGLPATETQELNVSALSGSALSWQVKFDRPNDLKVKLANSRGEEAGFVKEGEGFSYRDKLSGSGLYSIKAYWSAGGAKDSLVYQSAFYRLEAQPDLSPRIEPESKELYTYHYLKDKKTLTVTARISDDFKVKQSFIVATVARGSGENVKFREVKFPLSPSNFKQARLSKTIDLKALDFAPGDELYYYWAAIDNKEPEGNFSKSDTYFLVYKDTTKLDEAELATMAVNVMPEYFRSQRQIIIDTEKLIAKRKTLSKQQFNSTSNEIGFDQKVLRLRYGQYLGEEFETSIGGGTGVPDYNEEDPLEGFRHAHDSGEGDHSAAPPEPHGHEHNDAASHSQQDPVAALMEQYVHSHDNGELNTYYEQSTRSLLKMALEQMWQSELHLRLYEPEKALPFENKALEYLKSAQQIARSYVKKSGFDPPPIKEKEVRLTGEFKKVNPHFKQEREYDRERMAMVAGEVVGYLNFAQRKMGLNQAQKQRVLLLGSLLSEQIEQGDMKGWGVLAHVQRLAAGKPFSDKELEDFKSRLFALIGPGTPVTQPLASEKELQKSFWKNLK
ncbi:hypothetical protein [Telluribacter sp.]|jgi:hypothetical protein|uniref:hypothetical protein n=1 Tax=Telluribacter sp. TaxID=1978767 RepID=UPI002E139DF5|nr:hypothetical protein [Telluribacter sp.]